MIFKVRWEEKALDELTDLWLQADSGLRALITDATSKIDEQLLDDALAASDPHIEGRRILFASVGRHLSH